MKRKGELKRERGSSDESQSGKRFREEVRRVHKETRNVSPREERATSIAVSPATASHIASAVHISDPSAKLYGVAPVLEALRAGQRCIEHITIAEGARDNRVRELIELARAGNVPVRRAPRTDVERLAGAGANHQGVVATVAAAWYTDSDELLDALSARAEKGDAPLAVVLDGVEDPRNLGAILRTVECAGAHGVFIPERRAAGLTETVAKAAAGALEYVRVARAPNLVRLLQEFKQRNIWTVGASADAAMDYTQWDWRLPCAIVLGGEGAGLHRLVRERCDTLVRIPINGRIESLNVSVAVGIILYEAVRQRSAHKLERQNNAASGVTFK